MTDEINPTVEPTIEPQSQTPQVPQTAQEPQGIKIKYAGQEEVIPYDHPDLPALIQKGKDYENLTATYAPLKDFVKKYGPNAVEVAAYALQEAERQQMEAEQYQEPQQPYGDPVAKQALALANSLAMQMSKQNVQAAQQRLYAKFPDAQKEDWDKVSSFMAKRGYAPEEIESGWAAYLAETKGLDALEQMAIQKYNAEAAKRAALPTPIGTSQTPSNQPPKRPVNKQTILEALTAFDQ